MPEEYNARHTALGNLNELLADLHADALAELAEDRPGATLLVDRFADERLLRMRLDRRFGSGRRLVQVPRAEAHPAVAAASILARVHFLEGLQRCAEDSGTDLHKGAGPPVDLAARRVFQIGGAALLAKVAKLHFKNSSRIPGYRP